MPLSFSAGVRDSLSNLAASLGVGKDKAAYDAFGLRTLERAQIEAMYRGGWLARKVVDIVPFDTDYLEADLAFFEAGQIPNIPILEIRP